MDDREWLTQRFEEQRTRLTTVAYRMLGSSSDANDAVQEAWLRLDRADVTGVDNLSGWLTTVVARVCLDMLRGRATRREQPHGVQLPDPVVQPWPHTGPENPGDHAVLSDAVGLAMLVVLDTLTPAERVAFVLHDMFAVPFAEIAALLERTPAATKMLASRARRQVQGTPIPDTDLGRQRAVVDAFFAAARDGDFHALLAVLDSEVVLRSDGGLTRPNLTRRTQGARPAAKLALAGAHQPTDVRPVLVNNTAGALIVDRQGQPVTLMAFTITADTIAEIEILVDPERLHRLAAGVTGP